LRNQFGQNRQDKTIPRTVSFMIGFKRRLKHGWKTSVQRNDSLIAYYSKDKRESSLAGQFAIEGTHSQAQTLNNVVGIADVQIKQLFSEFSE